MSRERSSASKPNKPVLEEDCSESQTSLWYFAHLGKKTIPHPHFLKKLTHFLLNMYN